MNTRIHPRNDVDHVAALVKRCAARGYRVTRRDLANLMAERLLRDTGGVEEAVSSVAREARHDEGLYLHSFLSRSVSRACTLLLLLQGVIVLGCIACFLASMSAPPLFPSAFFSVSQGFAVLATLIVALVGSMHGLHVRAMIQAVMALSFLTGLSALACGVAFLPHVTNFGPVAPAFAAALCQVGVAAFVFLDAGRSRSADVTEALLTQVAYPE